LRQEFKNIDPEKISKKRRKDFDAYLSYKVKIEEKRAQLNEELSAIQGELQVVYNSLDEVESRLEGETLSNDKIKALSTNIGNTKDLDIGLAILNKLFTHGLSFENFNNVKDIIKEDVKHTIDGLNNQLNYQYNPDFDPRSIIGDNYQNVKDRKYGNNDVTGPESSHGTHVAGIIGASRINNIGIVGIADNVKVMIIRAIPDGDERDKDIANAIRYAVDNGASIVNMSFSKNYSWDKDAVDKAVRYAAKKNVLLIHAAGNNGMNNDDHLIYPNDIYKKRKLFGKIKADNWIEVGAISWKKENKVVANFSNYGKNNVDILL